MNRDNRFLRKEYLKNVFPIMFSVLGGTINALIDSVLVSRKMGSGGLAAVNVSMPVYFILCTIGALLAGGASVLSAQALGREEPKKSKTGLSQCINLRLCKWRWNHTGGGIDLWSHCRIPWKGRSPF